MVSGTMSALLSPWYWIRPLDCLLDIMSLLVINSLCGTTYLAIISISSGFPEEPIRLASSRRPRGDDSEDWTIDAWYGSSETTDHLGVQGLIDD